MRKILIALIMVVILVFTGVTVINGIQIGKFDFPNFSIFSIFILSLVEYPLDF